MKFHQLAQEIKQSNNPPPVCAPGKICVCLRGAHTGNRQAEFSGAICPPPEAPTTRGFAGILQEGLDGADVQTVLSVPGDLALRLSLTEAVSPLRLNGMSGMLTRIQRQVREKSQG